VKGKDVMNSTDELIRQVNRDSQEGFRELVRMHQASVQAYLGRYIRNLEIVEDLAQETFLKVFRNLGEYRGDSPLRIWIFGIARNLALMHLRQERSRRVRQIPGWLAFVEQWTMERIESEDSSPALQELKLSALEECLGRLPKRSASLIEDHYIRGYDGRRIAKETGRSEVSVRVTLLRIRQALRDCVERRLAAKGGTA
jgi:RNA polymerase sigma-70 factor (ECF subfamily)